MKMQRVQGCRGNYIRWSALGLALALVGILGCTSLPAAKTAGEQPKAKASDVGSPLWEEGVSALQRGDYQEAARVFETLSKSTAIPERRHRALYALACTRLLTAQNPDEFNAALNLWNLWSHTAPAEITGEDPRLMTALLPRLMPSAQANLTPQQLAPPGKSDKTNAAPTVKVIKDKECEKLYQESDREVQRLKRQIKTLRHQIEALESIHRTIQEKKKEVSTP
jgi:hypothetical protein